MSGNTWAVAVFAVLFIGTVLLGTLAMRLKRRRATSSLEEWGLGGRGFGVWVTWFLVGGDFYTAYTVIAVPALVYVSGAYGFFALPYTIIVYPFIYAAMPVLWRYAQAHGHVTAADVVRGRFGSRPLELAVAVTGLAAVMPYIALQLIGIQTVIHSLGLPGVLPLIAAFVSLAAYTWWGGLHAPALTAFVKDAMIYVVVLAAVTVIPLHLGGYGAVFARAASAYPAAQGLLLSPHQMLPYASLALGSALAAFLYPHTLTGVLAARSARAIETNAMLLPAYTLLLGLIAMLGFMAHAAGLHVAQATDVVPALFAAIFPPWFLGFADAAVAVGALVPASVMAIGAANLITRNIWKPRGASEARAAQWLALAVKTGALACVLGLSPRFAIDLQLLGGVWILQIFPAVILGLAWPGLRPQALLGGWVAGIVLGSIVILDDGLRPTHAVPGLGAVYTGLIALAVNVAVVALLTPLSRRAAMTGSGASSAA